MIDPETKAALGLMSTLMRFQGGEKANFTLLEMKYSVGAHVDSN